MVKSENLLKLQQRETRTMLMELFYQYLEMLNTLEIRENMWQSQQELYRFTEQKFRNGEKSMEELLLIQSGLLVAEEGLMKAKVHAQKIRQEIYLLTHDMETGYLKH